MVGWFQYTVCCCAVRFLDSIRLSKPNKPKDSSYFFLRLPTAQSSLQFIVHGFLLLLCDAFYRLQCTKTMEIVCLWMHFICYELQKAFRLSMQPKYLSHQNLYSSILGWIFFRFWFLVFSFSHRYMFQRKNNDIILNEWKFSSWKISLFLINYNNVVKHLKLKLMCRRMLKFNWNPTFTV